MDYEKEYKNRLDAARYWHDVSEGDIPLVLEEIFSELREDEDEIIKEELINYLKFRCNSTTLSGEERACNKWIDWLEKQGNTDNIIEKAKTEKQRVLITETDGNANIDWDTRSLEDTRKLLEYGLQYIEKQVERNPTDKAELKFNVGEWVVNKFGYSWHIDSFDKKNYQVSDGKGNYNYFPIAKHDEMRLWSITDAKGGDVLFAENFDNIGGCVFLFKGLDSWKFDAEGDRAIATGYCCVSITESGSADFGIQGPDCVEIKRVHPATKEQRDLLFQRMHEAGYMWDSKSKQLLSLKAEPSGKQKPAGWSEEDEQNLNVVLSYINDESIRRWLKDVIHKKYNKYAEWSEHDEIMKNHALQIINKYWNSLPDTDYDENEISESCYNWLKYIKERITWKPSKKQIIALRWVLNNIPYNIHKEEIYELLEQLNKL